MRLALIFNKTRADTIGIYFERACRSLGIPYDHWWLRDAARIPREYDLYLRIDHGDDYTVALPDHLRPQVFYAIDTHLRHSWRKIQKEATRYDAVFCCHREAIFHLPRAEWLPVACDPSLIEPVIPEGHGFDVAFIGTDGGTPRKFILQALRERYTQSLIGKAPHTQIMTIYRQAKIGFNYSIRGELNMRLFEVLGAGALLVTNAPRHPEELALLGLDSGVHLVIYHRPLEIFECIDAWLSQEQEEERLRIAHRGMTLAHERHTYVHRLQSLLQVATERLGVRGTRESPHNTLTSVASGKTLRVPTPFLHGLRVVASGCEE